MEYHLHEEELHGEPSSLFRVYSQADGFTNEDDYLGTFVVEYKGDTAEVKGLRSDIVTSQLLSKLKTLLRSKNIRYLEFRRAGGENRRYTIQS